MKNLEDFATDEVALSSVLGGADNWVQTSDKFKIEGYNVTVTDSFHDKNDNGKWDKEFEEFSSSSIYEPIK